MDFLDNVLEAGDASANLTPKRKKIFEIPRGCYEKSCGHKTLNKSLVCRTHPLATISNRTSPSIIDKRLCNYVALIQNNVIRMENDVTSTACPTDYCGFPYYRSCRANNSFHDNVLMKDIAVSCTLLDPNANKDNLTLSAIESYFLKQIKNEYQDFSVMTKKISSYTQDKLQNLSKKYKKRKSDANFGKRPVATEYIDKNGNICLKLRLKDLDCSGIKEESAVKNIISSFIVNSWNFLLSLQQRTENGRGGTKKNVIESPRPNCFCVHKENGRKDKRISQAAKKTPKAEISPEIDTVSHICTQKHDQYRYNCKMRKPNASEKKMQTVNIRIIERHRRN